MNRRKDPVGRYLAERKKQREKDAIRLDPADYDYMDDMPLEGWFWEIIRRGEFYKRECAAFQSDILSAKTEDDKWQILFERQLKHDLVTELATYFMVRKDRDISPEFFYKVRIGDYLICCPKPEARFIDVREHIRLRAVRPAVIRTYEECVEDIDNEIFFDESILSEAGLPPQLDEETADRLEQERLHEKLSHRLFHMLAVSSVEDTLYVGISKKARAKDIEDYLIPELKQYLQPSAVRVRDDKWLYYLIVYDLRNTYQQKISYKDIALKLQKAYPAVKETKVTKGKKKTKKVKSKDYFNAENCKNFYREAVVLISGDYRNYLYL